MKNRLFFYVFAKSTISNSNPIFTLKSLPNRPKGLQTSSLGRVLGPYGVLIFQFFVSPWPHLVLTRLPLGTHWVQLWQFGPSSPVPVSIFHQISIPQTPVRRHCSSKSAYSPPSNQSINEPNN